MLLRIREILSLVILFHGFTIIACSGRQPAQAPAAQQPVVTSNQQPAVTISSQQPPLKMECVFDGELEQLYMRDCTQELEALEERASPVLRSIEELEQTSGTRIGVVRAAVMGLFEQRRQLCHDWNACAMSHSEHMARYDWLNEELSMLERLLFGLSEEPGADELQALEQWASELSSRRSDLLAQPSHTKNSEHVSQGAETGPSKQAPGVPSDLPVPDATRQRMQLLKRQHEREIAELQALLKLAGKVRALVPSSPSLVMPKVCQDIEKLRKQLRVMIRGENSAVGHQAEWTQEVLDRYCMGFQRWAHPTDRDKSRLTSLLAKIEEHDDRMVELLRCIDPGPYSRECIGDFGPLEPNGEAQHKTFRRLLKQASLKLKGTSTGKRGLPCDSPLWEQLSKLERTDGVLYHRVRSIGKTTQSICKSMEIDEGTLTKRHEQILRDLDVNESWLKNQIRAREETLIKIQPFL